MAPVIQDNRVLYEQFYLPVDQSDAACFHYPDLSPGQTVVLPGQCDDSIPVVQNFDVAAFTGVWYQIERYPQVWEAGTCGTAVYSLDEETGVVTVINSELRGGDVATDVGTAVLISDDGSARILVTFFNEVEGSDEPVESSMVLHILGTDYTSYAVSFTCTNVNQFQRAVGTWKLSRSQEFTNAAQAAVNGIVSAYPELHQPYFIDSEQNEDCPAMAAAEAIKSTVAFALLVALLNLVL